MTQSTSHMLSTIRARNISLINRVMKRSDECTAQIMTYACQVDDL